LRRAREPGWRNPFDDAFEKRNPGLSIGTCRALILKQMATRERVAFVFRLYNSNIDACHEDPKTQKRHVSGLKSIDQAKQGSSLLSNTEIASCLGVLAAGLCFGYQPVLLRLEGS
jgi:hypothetical protein